MTMDENEESVSGIFVTVAGSNKKDDNFVILIPRCSYHLFILLLIILMPLDGAAESLVSERSSHAANDMRKATHCGENVHPPQILSLMT